MTSDAPDLNGTTRSSSSSNLEEEAVNSPSREESMSNINIMMQRLRACGEAVGDIASALGLGHAQLSSYESIGRLEVTCDLAVDGVMTWESERVGRWFECFGTDLSIALSLSGLDPSFEAPEATLIANEAPIVKLQDFLDRAQALLSQQGNEIEITARVSIGKTLSKLTALSLIAMRCDYLGTAEALSHTQVLVFYFTDAWKRLASPYALWTWESEEIVKEGCRTLVALCDSAGYCAGVALEVLGVQLRQDVRWLPVTRRVWRAFQERAQKTRLLHEQESYWGTAPKVLTPDHLRVEGRNEGLYAVLTKLAQMRMALSVAFLASTVTGDRQTGLTLRFAGARPSRCLLPADDATPSVTWHTIEEGISELAAWAYTSASPDKLMIARECLAEELPAGESVTLDTVQRAAPTVLEAAKANLVLYLRHNTKQYFEHRQQALDAVHGYAESVRQSVASLTTDLVNDLYKTVGVIIGVVVAGLLQPSASVVIQPLACAAYSAYIGFILWYVMHTRQRRFQREMESLDARLSTMSELGGKDRRGIRQIATADDDDFASYFKKTVIVYRVLLVGGLVCLVLTIFLPIPFTAGLHPHAILTPSPALR